MTREDQLIDLKMGCRFLTENIGKYPVTCLIMLAQALCYVALRLAEAGQLPIDFQLWFFGVYENRILSTAAIAEGRYYTLFTSLLFISNWIELLSAWIGLWLILAPIEKAFRGPMALLVVILSCVANNAAFLQLAGWSEAEAAGGLSEAKLKLLDWCRPERTFNTNPWRSAPLWWGAAVFSIVRMGSVLVPGKIVLMWLILIGMVVAEFTIVRQQHGQYFARDGLAASAAAGLVLGLLSFACSAQGGNVSSTPNT